MVAALPTRTEAVGPSAHAGSGCWGRPAKCQAVSSCSVDRTLTAKGAPSRYRLALDSRVTVTWHSGGSSETAVNALTVAPCGTPSSFAQVTTVTPVANRPKALRRVRESSGIDASLPRVRPYTVPAQRGRVCAESHRPSTRAGGRGTERAVGDVGGGCFSSSASFSPHAVDGSACGSRS